MIVNMDYRITDHAQQEMDRRSISRTELDAVMQAPQQVVPGFGGRTVYQSIMSDGYLLRVIADQENVPVVVTLYRTSKIAKYWRTG
jgi:hypothetical protein